MRRTLKGVESDVMDNTSSWKRLFEATAINPADQPRVTELGILVHRRLHLIDDLEERVAGVRTNVDQENIDAINAELNELFRELYELTGDPAMDDSDPRPIMIIESWSPQ